MRYTQAIVRQPARSLSDGITTQQLGTPDIDLAIQQHATYVATLRKLDVNVTVLEADERFPDSVFVEDVAVIHRGVAILTRPGAVARRGEVAAMRDILAARLPIVELGGDEEARVDGGDVLICGTHVLVGISQRTTHAGAKQLARRLNEIDPALSVMNVPLTGVLHLKTGITALRPRLLLRDPACQSETTFPFARTVTLPAAQGYAANVLPINGGVIIAQGYPAVASLAEEHHSRVFALDMSEFHKMDGSLTCLSLLW